MLKQSNHAFIIDLGLAVDLSSAGCFEGGEKPLNSPVGAVGTMGYIPPEVMRNEKVESYSYSHFLFRARIVKCDMAVVDGCGHLGGWRGALRVCFRLPPVCASRGAEPEPGGVSGPGVGRVV